MRKIIPTILAENLEDFNAKLSKLVDFSDEIQIDITDGEFTSSKTVELIDIKELPSNKTFEAHLMVADPLDYIFHCKRLGIKRIIFHDEVEANTAEVINKIKSEGFEVFIALNPDTQLSQLTPHIPNVDGVLLMSVDPGYGGQELLPGSIVKIKKLRANFPDVKIGLDGGINKANIKSLFEDGINIAYIGSGILKAQNPKQEWEEFNSIIAE